MVPAMQLRNDDGMAHPGETALEDDGPEHFPRVVLSTKDKSRPRPPRRRRRRAIQFVNANKTRAVCLSTLPFSCGAVSQPVTAFVVGIATEDGCFFGGLNRVSSYARPPAPPMQQLASKTLNKAKPSKNRSLLRMLINRAYGSTMSRMRKSEKKGGPQLLTSVRVTFQEDDVSPFSRKSMSAFPKQSNATVL